MAQIINIKNINAKYTTDGEKLFDSISFCLDTGDRIALFGPSGCGKTTLISLINGTLGSEEILVSSEAFSIKKDLKIATVFQTPRLIPWLSVTENIRFPMVLEKLEREKQNTLIADVLVGINLSRYSKYYPKELSTGMQQRINMARALAIKPQLIMLDEPFSSLDAKNKRLMKQELMNLLVDKNVGCILVSHDIFDVLEICDKILILSEKPTRIKRIINVSEYKNTKDLVRTINGIS
jgi:ABC-type nitrate/sulfonate/bicarbonate transport system ATPase subunit